jgi:dihydrofolate reductase
MEAPGLNSEHRKLILYIAMSLDGYIAGPGDDLSFLSMVEKEGEDYGYAVFLASVDAIIIGRKTYDWVLKHVPEYAHPDKEVFVITRTPKPATGNTTFYTGSLTDLIHELKHRPGRNIFCDGGAEIVNELLQHHLIDEFIISIIPTMIGIGTRLFKDNRPPQGLTLISCHSFEKGLVQLHYKAQS